MSGLQIVSIIGNIGVGKSSTVDALRQRSSELSVLVVNEPVDQWRKTGLLQAFYASLHPSASIDKRQHTAYAFQQFAFASRLSSIRRAVHNLKRPSPVTVVVDGHVLVDRHVFATQLFETGNISSEMWTWYNETFNDWQVIVPEAQPKIIIYLRAQPQTCLDRIRKRGRIEEANITLGYLQALHDKFERLVVTPDLIKCPVTTIDCDAMTDEEVTVLVANLVRRELESDDDSLFLFS